MKKIILICLLPLAILRADFTLIGDQLTPTNSIVTEPNVNQVQVVSASLEKVVNGDFNTDTVWNKDTSWTISNGTANVDSTGLSNEWLTQPGILTIGETYTVTFTVSNYVSGSIGTDSWYPDYTDSGNVSSNGVHTITFTAAQTDFALKATGDTILSIDDVSLKESSNTTAGTASVPTVVAATEPIVTQQVLPTSSSNTTAGTASVPTVAAATEPIVTQQVLPTSNSEYTIVPGVYGFGTGTRAAYGGNVDPVILHVDTLAKGISNTDSTHGSFEWAVSRSYPRIVVFDVSGVIQCDDKIQIGNPYLTVAGQTAPDHIVIDGSITIHTHDVLFTHFAVRPTHNIHDRDAIAITAYNGPNYNIVIDHCSTSWATDENIQVWTSRSSNSGIYNVTFSNLLVAEGINEHACGFINSARSIDMQGSILAHNDNRHPFLKEGSETAFWNNLIYNYGYKVAQVSGDYTYNAPCKLDFRGNVAIAGSDTGSNINSGLVRINSDYGGGQKLELFMADNIRGGILKTGFDVDNGSGLTGYEKTSTPLTLPIGAKPYSSALTYDTVLANAGARPANRDSVDARIINDIQNETGSSISTPPAMPHYTETKRAFIPVSNPNAMYNEYYTNLEHQLHQMAAELEKSNSSPDDIVITNTDMVITNTIDKWHGLVNQSKSGELNDVTYIMVGDSHRASKVNSRLFPDMIEPAFNALGVDSILNASGGQTAYDWSRDIDQNKVSEVIASIPGTGEHTLVDISFGGNDRDAGYTLEETRDSLMLGVQKIKDAKPDTLIVWSSYPPADNTGKNADEDSLFNMLDDTTPYHVINVKKDVFPLSWSTYNDAGEYLDSTHLNPTGQTRVADYLEGILIPT